MNLPLSLFLTLLFFLAGSSDSLLSQTNHHSHASRSQSAIFATVTAIPANDRRVNIIWKTVSENLAESYSVLHTTDGQNWMTLGAVLPGDSASGNTYKFTHFNAPAGDNYYRIQCSTLTTDPQLSEIVYAKCEEPPLDVLFPNPASSHVYFNHGPATGVALRLFNSYGKDVTCVLGHDLRNGAMMDVSRLTEGIYYLHTDTNVFKFVVAH